MSRPLLTRFDERILKDKDATKVQIPATFGTVNFYRQGATASQTKVFPPELITSLSVYDAGDLRSADQVQVGIGGTILIVDVVLSTTQVTLLNPSPLESVTVNSGDRLIVTTARPTVFSDPRGTVAAGSSVSINAEGRPTSAVYLRERRFDYVVSSISPSASRLYVDALGGIVPTPTWLDANDYGGIQKAIDALPAAGGVVFVPAGTWNVTATIVLPATKRVRLVGEGIGRTIILASGANPTSFDIIELRGDDSSIEDLTIQGPNLPPAVAVKGRGIVIGRLGETMHRPAIRRCHVRYTARWGLYILGEDEQVLTHSVFGSYEDTNLWNNVADGGVFIGRSNTIQHFRRCDVVGFMGPGLRGMECHGLSAIDCNFEANFSTVLTPYVELISCHQALFEHCWFEEDLANLAHVFMRIGTTGNTKCHDVTISSCRYVRKVLNRVPNLIEVNDGSTAVLVSNPEAVVISDVGFPTSRADIIVNDSSEVTVLGGKVVKQGTPNVFPLLVQDEKSVQIGVPFRARMPRLTSSERDALLTAAPDLKEGDFIYNRDLEEAQVWADGLWSGLVRRAGAVDIPDSAGDELGNLVPAQSVAGMWRVSAYAKVLVAAAGGSMVLDAGWNDGTPSREATLFTLPMDSVNTWKSGGLELYSAAGAPIQYRTLLSGGGHYMLRLRAERI